MKHFDPPQGDVIKIEGIGVQARHGVYESEKKEPQLFIIDLALFLDMERAALLDDVCVTADYAEAAKLAVTVARDNCFNLIETLAREIAFAVAKRFPLLSAVSATVHKPEADLGVLYSDVSATYTAKRTVAILSLGSNEGDRYATLTGAVEQLKKIDGVGVLSVSGFIETAPYGGVAQNKFLNCAVKISTLLGPRALLDNLHRIESDFGRVRKERWGDRTLDMDIVFFGSEIIEEEGLCIPHPDYLGRSFVLDPAKEIAPDFVCPITHKRLADLKAEK